MYTHILISTDGSELAQNGVDHGLSLAKALGSKVTIVTVTAPFPSVAGTASSAGWVATKADAEHYDTRHEEFASRILAAAEAAARKMGVEATTVHVSDALAARTHLAWPYAH